MPYMYIVRGPDGTLYTGSAWDLSHRMDRHGSKPDAEHTSRRRRSLTLVYFEYYDRIDEAYYREREVHGWARWRKNRLIEEGPCGRDPPEWGWTAGRGARHGSASGRSGWRHPPSVPP